MSDGPSPIPQPPETAPSSAPSPIATLARLWDYINERKVVQWTIAYVALAYSVQQGVGLTVDAFEWPQAVLRVSMLLLALGLPLVVTLAWYHGDRGSQRVSGPELTIISMLLVVGSVLFFMFVRPSAEQQAATAPKEQASVAAPRTGSAAEAGAVSLAVLPFANMSGDPAQEFFSDGMTEEITSALIKIPDLRVVARTSAFQYKGEKTDARAVGRALGATHLIEGSVRRAGDRVRITAQLIQADTGVSLWTNNYDRVSTDVFAIQEEIAQAIAGALQMPLGLAAGEHLVSQSSIAPESYEQFLRARAIFRSRNQQAAAPGPNRFAEATNMLEQVVARDPGYAPAWALLARMAGSREKREMAAREAIRLDPRSAMAYQAWAGLEAAQGNRAGTEDLLEKALLLDPNDPEVLDGFSNQLALAGRLKEALVMREKLRTLEPFAPVYNFITASVMLYDGKGRVAIPILEALPAAPPRNAVLAHAYAAEGRYEEAADVLLALAQNATPQGAAASVQTVEAARLLRGISTKLETPEALPILENALNFVYVYVGAPDRVLDYQERQVARYPNLGSAEVRYLWSPEFAPVRQTERFKTFVRKIGLVDYWRARGWADRCRAQGADDFVCD